MKITTFKYRLFYHSARIKLTQETVAFGLGLEVHACIYSTNSVYFIN